MDKAQTLGQKYYQLRLQNLDNHQIAEREGVSHLTVAARVCEYRKKNNLPKLAMIRKKTKPKAENKKKSNHGAQKLAEFYAGEKERRKAAFDQIFRRSDGVLVCPPRYCQGYGYK